MFVLISCHEMIIIIRMRGGLELNEIRKRKMEYKRERGRVTKKKTTIHTERKTYEIEKAIANE